MKKKQIPPTSRMKTAIFMAFFLFCLPLQITLAQSPSPTGIVENGVIPPGQTIEGSLFLTDPQVKIEGIVDGDVFAISQDVVVSGEIKGSLFALSQAVTIDGRVEGDLYTASARLNLGTTAWVGRNAYTVVGLVGMLPGSIIGRDLYLIALGGNLSGLITRSQHAHVGALQILNLLFGESGLLRPFLPSGFQLPFEGTMMPLSIPVERASSVLTGFRVSGMGAGIGFQPLTLAKIQPLLQLSALAQTSLADWLVAQLRAFAPLLFMGFLILWLFPRFLQGSTENLRGRPWRSLGDGTVAFFVGHGAALLALALVLAVGLFFTSINYWDFAILSWAAGLGGLGVALVCLELAALYLSKIIVGFLLGSILLARLPATAWGRRFWMLLLGEITLALLLAIPILGWVLSVLVILFGLGAIYQYLTQRRPSFGQKPNAPATTEYFAPPAPSAVGRFSSLTTLNESPSHIPPREAPSALEHELMGEPLLGSNLSSESGAGPNEPASEYIDEALADIPDRLLPLDESISERTHNRGKKKNRSKV